MNGIIKLVRKQNRRVPDPNSLGAATEASFAVKGQNSNSKNSEFPADLKKIHICMNKCVCTLTFPCQSCKCGRSRVREGHLGLGHTAESR